MTDLPNFYIYEDKGEWHRTDEELTKLLNSPTFNDYSVLAGHSFYPQWPAPEFKNQTRYAWRITPEGAKVVRCERLTRQHQKKHGNNCHMINDKECEYTRAKMLRWDDKRKFWVLNNTNE